MHVTFWLYVPEQHQDQPSSRHVAAALDELHRCLAQVIDLAAGRTYEEQLDDAILALDTEGFAPLLTPSDRQLLKEALRCTASETRDAPRTVVHGSPHRMNILTRDNSPVFIDLETIQLGPVEWDLAHLEPEVAHHYRHPHDEKLLAQCRVAVSAATAAWCWGALDRGPDMRSHAEHHLAVVHTERS